jgi:hypothetical protein
LNTIAVALYCKRRTLQFNSTLQQLLSYAIVDQWKIILQKCIKLYATTKMPPIPWHFILNKNLFDCSLHKSQPNKFTRCLIFTWSKSFSSGKCWILEVWNGHFLRFHSEILQREQQKIVWFKNFTRNNCSLGYVVPECKTSQFQKSYFVRTVKLWNSLPTSTRCLSSAACFRSALYHHYKSALDSTFDCDNISTWKSVCPKCLFTRDLTSSSYRQCC